jgi:transposase
MSNNGIDQTVEREKIKHKIESNPKLSFIYDKDDSDLSITNIDSVDTNINTNSDINSSFNDSNITDKEYKFSNYDISNSKCRILGLTYFLNCIAKKIGLISVLQEVFPEKYNHILTIAYFLIATNDPYLYCSDWIDKNITNLESNELSSQRISDLMNSITFKDRMNFYSCWSKLREEVEYLATDITSISSYSNLIEFVESGYNREGDKLKQINLCLLFGEKSGLPVFCVQYPGSLNDVSTLCTTLMQFSLLRDNDYKIVSDKGFYSVKNINYMLNQNKVQEFLVGVPFGKKYAREMIENSSDLTVNENIINAGADILFGKKTDLVWKSKGNKNKNLFLYTYYNEQLRVTARDALYKKAFALKDKVKKEKAREKDFKDIKKYLIIPEGNIKVSLRDIQINVEQIKKEIKYTGWLIVIGNSDLHINDVINIYRSKDVVEKGFEQLKERLQLRRIRVHSSQNMESKLFITFITHIILSYINKNMQEHNLYQTYTLKEMLKKFESIVLKEISGNMFLNELTHKQKELLNLFDFPNPTPQNRL